ncbi:MAG: pyridoxamine 5'-phosphate oxidase family protein [Thermodesulfobacteriota bacterium]
MRKKDKEINDNAEIESILNRAEVCRLGLCYNNIPYIVPLNFGYKDNCIYLHSFPEGQKIDFLKRNNNVCFEIDVDCKLLNAEKPCDWSMKYRSVIGFGKASLLQELQQKKAALDIIMAHYSNGTYEYPENVMNALSVIKVRIESITGKKLGYK